MIEEGEGRAGVHYCRVLNWTQSNLCGGPGSSPHTECRPTCLARYISRRLASLQSCMALQAFSELEFHVEKSTRSESAYKHHSSTRRQMSANTTAPNLLAPFPHCLYRVPFWRVLFCSIVVALFLSLEVVELCKDTNEGGK